jgi:hypothetical protein
MQKKYRKIKIEQITYPPLMAEPTRPKRESRQVEVGSGNWQVQVIELAQGR